MNERKFYAVRNPNEKPGSIRIWGESDDLVEVDGWLREEFGRSDGSTTLRIGGMLLVTMSYDGRGGTWTAKLEKISENKPIPWKVLIGSEGHSVLVEVCCPVGTLIEVDHERDDG